MRSIPPPMTFSISEFHDEDFEGQTSSQPQTSSGVSNENWRRPRPKQDRTTLVENMDI